MEYAPLSRFRKFISRVSELSTTFGDQLQLRGFKTGGTAGQVPVKTASGDFLWSWQTLTISGTAGLQAALDGKAAFVHTHTIANVTGLQTALDGKLSLTGGTVTGDLVVTGGLNLAGLPTSAVGLVAGDVWNDVGTLKIV